MDAPTFKSERRHRRCSRRCTGLLRPRPPVGELLKLPHEEISPYNAIRKGEKERKAGATELREDYSIKRQ